MDEYHGAGDTEEARETQQEQMHIKVLVQTPSNFQQEVQEDKAITLFKVTRRTLF